LTINLISVGVAVLFTLVLPLGYFLVAYFQQAAALELEVKLYADVISQVAPPSASPAGRAAFEVSALKKIVARDQRSAVSEVRRILDADNNLIFETGTAVESPFITKGVALGSPDKPFARVEISRSIWPLLERSALAVVLGAGVGVGSLIFLRMFPLRALTLARREIETRRQTENSLQESLALLNATLESTADGILVADQFGRIVSFNRRFTDMWRIPDEVVASGDHNELVKAVVARLLDPAAFMRRLRELKGKTEVKGSSREVLELSDGRFVEVDARPQEVNGTTLGRVLSFHDITERRRTEGLLAGEKQALEMIVTQAPLREVLITVAHRIEELSGKMFCGVLIPDDRGRFLHMPTPLLPKDYLEAAEQVAPALHAETGKVAAPHNDSGRPLPEVVQSLMEPYRELAEKHNLRVGAVKPVYSSAGTLLGIVAGYYHLFDTPAPDDDRLLEIAANLSRIVIERKSSENRLEYLAHYDSLTGLPNRGLFRDRLGQAMARAERLHQSLALMFLDLDRFKVINDTLGHAIGDQLLRAVGLRLRSSVRAEDTVARLGGDEFTVLMERISAPGDATTVAQKILAALSPPFNIGGREIFATASIGITVYPQDPGDMDGLLINADSALYAAKQAGRNTFRFYIGEMNEKALERLEVENDLRRALERGEFVLYYQPKVNLVTGKLAGAEALIRWLHPQRGIVQPLEFVSLLEDTGMINEVGRWALQTACDQIRNWMDEKLPPLRVAVNISARQFLHYDLGRDVSDALNSSGVPPDRLELELTESVLMQNPERANELLQTIRALGVVRIDIDDFGTGYSSLSYLKRFPINTVKIDASFVRGLPDDHEDSAIVQAVIAMAHSLGLKVIAEGVENEQQVEFLRLHQCDEIQGYILSSPLPSWQFKEWARQGGYI
jgi:diguanylate cyclase (GGDEF)-like protein/PAS domain S-box-containing protein